VVTVPILVAALELVGVALMVGAIVAAFGWAGVALAAGALAIVLAVGLERRHLEVLPVRGAEDDSWGSVTEGVEP
jgi:hypothetical protein